MTPNSLATPDRTNNYFFSIIPNFIFKKRCRDYGIHNKVSRAIMTSGVRSEGQIMQFYQTYAFP